jgi:glycosyltransferase involved in cell wall biosynthesis
MRVAIYAGMFKKNQDGATKTLYELVNSLLENNMEVGVWAFTLTPQKRDGLQLFRIPSVPLPFYPEYKLSIPNGAIKRQLDSFAPDVLHITVPDLVGIYLMRYARKRGIPVLTSYHTDFPSYLKSYHLGALYKPAWRFFKWFYNKSRLVLAPTVEMIEKLKNHGIRNVKLWNRGIHLHHFSSQFRSTSLRRKWGAVNKKVILYCGRFVWYKDLRTFIETYDLFKQNRNQDVQFVLAGDGPIRDELESRMPDALFTGYLGVNQLAEVYASSDMLLFPSTTETFGNVVLEGLSSGIPAVVSDEGGCKEIVKQSNGGMIAKARDASDFYMCCKQLLENRSLYHQYRENGLVYALRQDWKRINNRVIREYHTIIESQRTPTKKTSRGLVGNRLPEGRAGAAVIS